MRASYLCSLMSETVGAPQTRAPGSPPKRRFALQQGQDWSQSLENGTQARPPANTRGHHKLMAQADDDAL